MGFWRNIGRKIQRWLSGGNSQRSTPPAPRVNYINRDARNQTVSSNTGINRRAFLDSFKDGGSDSRSGEKEEKRVQDSFKASKYSYKSMADSNKESSFEKLDKALKKDVPDPKEAARQKAQKNAKAYIEHSKKGVAEFHERTGHKYDTRTGDKEHDKEAARLVKGGFAYSDPEAEKNAVKYHPIATSAARGAASGATFGATELAIKKTSKNDKERAEAEKYYQENKNKVAEGVGEVLGSLASFGVTAGATDALGEAAIRKVAPNAAERLAQTGAVKGLAKRSVNKAVKKGLIRKELATEAGGELISKVGLQKANKIANALGTDIVQNLTTGAIYDINKASAEYEVGSADWWKELGKSAAMNFAITGAIGGVSAFKGGKKMAAEEAGKIVQSRTKRLQGNLLGKATAGERAIDRALVNEGAYGDGDIGKGILPQNEVDVSALADGRFKTKGDIRLKDYNNYQASKIPLVGNAAARTPIESGNVRIQDLVNVPTAKDVRLDAVNKELDEVYERIQRGSRTMPQEELEALSDRFYRLLDERNALESGESVGESIAREADEAIARPQTVEDALINETPAEMPRVDAEATAKAVNPEEQAWEEQRQNILDYINSDEPTTQAKGTKEAAENLKPKDSWDNDFAMVGDEMPVENINQTRLNDATAEAQARARRVMSEEPISEEASAAKGAAKQTGEAAEEASEREFTQGQKEARKAFYDKTGTNPETGKAATDDQILESMGNYHRSQGTSAERKLSRVAMSQVGVSSEEAAEKLLKMQDEGELGYDVIHHADMYKEVANDLANDSDRWIDKLCDVVENDEWSGKESTKLLYMAQYLAEVTDAAKSPEQDALATMAYKAIQKLSTTSAQTLNGRRAYAHLSKAGKMECALDDMVSVLDSALGFNKQHRQAMQGLNKYEREHYIKSQLLKDDKLKECLKKLANAKTEDDISEAYTEMFYQFNKSNPKSGFDVVQELRYLNMLGNPKTHIRNIFGSGFFAPMRQISNMIRSGIEGKIAEKAGLEITRHGGLSLEAAAEAWAKEPKTEAGKAALDAFERRKKDLLGSAKYDTPTYKGRGKTLAGKALDALSDFNSNLLTKEDDFFKSRAFRENYIKSYNRYVKDGKPITDKIKKQIEEEALQEAQIATFNEYNEFAKWLSNITRKANDANASALGRWGGRAVNAVMPFTKVPANLMKQSINYSPLGIAKGMLNIKQAAKQGDAQLLNRAIDDLASGLTGTGVFGLGMLLGKTTDMFTTNAGKNDPAAKFKKDRGMQNYSITFKDPETGQGHSFTLDWLVPMSATFFSGIEMANQLKTGDFDIMDIGNDWSTVMTRLAEPVMETSMLSGLHGMLETMRGGSDADDDKSAIGVLLRETVQSYLSSLVPTALGQVTRTAYKTDMQITGDDDWQYFWNQTKYKAGLANRNILGEPLGADTDAYGNVKGDKGNTLVGAIKEGDTEALANYGKAALKNFLSPANIQKVDFSEVDNEKLRTYEEAVKNGADPEEMAYLFPKKQYKKQFKLAGENVPMTNRELSTYNQAKTTGGEEGMRFVLENIMFNRYDYDAKGNKVPTADAYTTEQKQALMQQFKGKSMREVEQWLYKQPEFQNATDAERKKAIEGLWKLTKDSNAVASQRVGERAVYEAQGKDGYEYDFKNEVTEKKREALQPAVDSGLLTYQDVVDFERNGGKVSYSDEDGGSSTTYYSKKSMIEYFVANGIPYEKAEALYNAYKNKNAKPYSGNNLSSGYYGRRRRGYGGYRRSGGSSKTVTPPEIKQSSYKASKQTYKSMAETLKTSPQTNSTKMASVKVEPPKVKFKKYEV